MNRDTRLKSQIFLSSEEAWNDRSRWDKKVFELIIIKTSPDWQKL
jgi:hypothetical protein